MAVNYPGPTGPTLRIDTTLHRELKIACVLAGVTMREVVELLVDAWLNEQEQEQEQDRKGGASHASDIRR